MMISRFNNTVFINLYKKSALPELIRLFPLLHHSSAKIIIIIIIIIINVTVFIPSRKCFQSSLTITSSASKFNIIHKQITPLNFNITNDLQYAKKFNFNICVCISLKILFYFYIYYQ